MSDISRALRMLFVFLIAGILRTQKLDECEKRKQQMICCGAYTVKSCKGGGNPGGDSDKLISLSSHH